MTQQAMPTETAYDRLVRWRDVGDQAPSYCAGDGNFGADVVHVLAEIERAVHSKHDFVKELRRELTEIAEYWNGSALERPAADAAKVMRERAKSAVEMIDSYLALTAANEQKPSE